MNVANEQAVILAGGLATRMRPFTLKTPKALLDVAGRPFIDWQLEKLAACGFRDVVLCIAHLGEAIREHVGDGARFGLSVHYSDEGPTLLGTLGALRKAFDLLAPTFLVTYGDSYLPFDYQAPLRLLETYDDCDGVMSVYKNAGQWDASNVVTDGIWVSRYEKGVKDPAFDHIDYGAIALRRNVVAATAPGTRADLAVLQEELARQGRLRAYPAAVRFFEIGSPEGLATLTDHLLFQKRP
ncbi:NTP transferase domain-containing protein [Pendulispora brunnea]|uniref:NTP transferase domain-containing protein n=1 Tax=Pendulispora brunnea TaxID=2905690 RepID=A0ABZ2K4T4_9BACT